MPRLHVAVAADLFRQARDLGSEFEIPTVQLQQQLLDAVAVFVDQRALDAAFLAAAEDVQRRASRLNGGLSRGAA